MPFVIHRSVVRRCLPDRETLISRGFASIFLPSTGGLLRPRNSEEKSPSDPFMSSQRSMLLPKSRSGASRPAPQPKRSRISTLKPKLSFDLHLPLAARCHLGTFFELPIVRRSSGGESRLVHLLRISPLFFILGVGLWCKDLVETFAGVVDLIEEALNRNTGEPWSEMAIYLQSSAGRQMDRTRRSIFGHCDLDRYSLAEVAALKVSAGLECRRSSQVRSNSAGKERGVGYRNPAALGDGASAD